MGKKGERVLTGGGDEEAFSRGIFRAYAEDNLRYSQLSPVSMFEERNTGSNLPAQFDLYAAPGEEYELLFIAKGGGSANKSFLYQATPATLHPDRLLPFIDEKIRTLGTAACPPYHLAVAIGGTSAELNLKTVKLASTGYLDGLPTEGGPHGNAYRDREMEENILEATRAMGIGAQFGGKYFCHDVRVVRLPRHGASLPIGIGVSCSADRQALARITRDGVFLEALERDPARFLPETDADMLGGEVVALDLNRPDGRDPGRALAPPDPHAPCADRPDHGGARPRAPEDRGEARRRRSHARLLPRPSDLLCRPGQDAGGHGVRLVRPHHGRAHGRLRGRLPGRRRQPCHARQGQPLGPGDGGLQGAWRLLSGLGRRLGGAARPGPYPQGGGPGISGTRHGSDLAHRGRGTSPPSSSSTTRANDFFAGI